ncbi:hypothetical protein ABRP70_14585 [Pectobacterium odoriferum]|uniref:capsular polysaccharide export protein, LipB/KpsS family n=1 Tax=Pectobacterium TaxID=122277 RepID=UPI001BB2E150|nr:hypothetical protein [Pectobacterium versatile]
MNILILINAAPKYKYFFHELAKVFEKNGHKIYYAIDSVSSKYIEPLSEIDDSQNSFYFSTYFEGNYRKDMDVLYSCTYGEFFYSDFDRFLTHGYNLNKDKYYWHQTRLCLDHFFKEIIETKNIDFVLYENISNSFAYSAWRISKLLGRKYIGLMGSRLPGRFEIQTSIIDDEVTRIKRLATESVSEADKKWFDDYRKNIINIQPDYMKNNSLNSVSLDKLLKLNRLKTLYRILKARRNINDFYEYQRGGIWKKIFNNTVVNLHRFIIAKITKKFFVGQDVLADSQDNFYVYPIHYHPESSTSVLAPEYTNEYSNIINIVNNLPFGTYLYVKDHISAKGIQPYGFYKKISNLPNVKLIDSSVNIKLLIKKSKGIITVNSTAGYEALLLEKPVYLLGRVFYECFPYVYKIDRFKDIKELLLTSKNVELSELSAWYIAYLNYTYNGKLMIYDSCKSDFEYLNVIYSSIINSITFKK